MKIALVAKPIHSLPSRSRDYHTWAPGVVMAAEAKALVDAGHDLRVYAAAGSQVPGELVDLGFQPIHESAKHPSVVQQGIRNVFDQNLHIAKVIEHLKQNPVDIIHIHDYRDYPIFAAAGLADRLVCTVHGNYDYNFEGRIKPTSDFLPEMNIVSLTDPVPGSKLPKPLAVIPNTFDADRFNLVEKPKPRAVFVGRFSEGKGAELLPEIAKHLDMQIDVYGGSPTEQFDQSLIEKFEATPNINYLGRLEHDRIHEAFDAQVLLFTSTSPEGFPLVLIEAASRGTPAVAFDLPNIDQVIAPQTGAIVAHGDVKAFARAATKVAQLDRQACRDRALNSFGPKIFATKLEQAFQSVISK